MPEIHAHTPRESYTIAGETFAIPMPYAAGHHLSDGEANALNQTYAENIRNNLASKLKDEKEAGTFDQSVFQEKLNDYCDSYEFGVRTGGGRTTDPVTAEAMTIARDLVRKAIVNKGVALSTVKAANITELAKGVLEKNPQIMETARARVEEVRSIADIELGELTGTEPDETSKPSRSKKSEAAAA